MRWLRRLARVAGLALLWALLVVVIVTSATIDILRSPGGRRYLRSQLHQRLAAIVPGLRIATIGGDYTHSLVLRGISLTDRFGLPVAMVDEFAVEYDLGRLPAREALIRRVTVRKPRLWLQPTQSSKLNVTELVLPQPSQAPPEKAGSSSHITFAGRIERFEIIEGEVISGVGKDRIRVRGLNVRLSVLGASTPKGPSARVKLDKLSLRLLLPGGREIPLVWQLDAGLGEAMAFSARSTLKAVVAGKNVEVKLQARGAPSRAEGTLHLAIAGGGTIALDVEGGMPDDKPITFVLRSLRVDGLDLSALDARMPATKLNLKATAKGMGIPTTKGSRFEASLRVAPSLVAGQKIREIATELSSQGDRWRLKRLLALVPGVKLKASGHGRMDRMEAQLGLQASDLRRLRLPAGLPKLAGALKVKARLGAVLSRQAHAQIGLRARGVTVQDLSVEDAKLELGVPRLPLKDLRPAALLAALRGNLTLRARGIRKGKETLLRRVELSAAGRRSKMSLTLRASGKKASARMAATGKVGRRGVELSFARIMASAAGRSLRLLEPTRLTLGFDGAARLAHTRLALLGGKVALAGHFSPRGFPRLEANVKLSNLQLPGAPPVSSTLSLRAGRRVFEVGMRASIAGQPMTLQASLPVHYGRGPFPEPNQRRPLELRMDAPVVDLAAFKPYLPRAIAPLTGIAGLTLRVGGSLRRPRVSTGLTLKKLSYGSWVSGASGSFRFLAGDRRVSIESNLSHEGRELLTASLAVERGVSRLLGRRQSLATLSRLPLRVAVAVKRLPLMDLVGVVPALADVKGYASLQLAGKGTLGAASLKWGVGIDELEVHQRKVGRLALEGAIHGSPSDVRLEASLRENGRRLLLVAGTLGSGLPALLRNPAAVGRAKLTLDAEVPAYAIAGAARLFPNVPLSGDLSARVRIRGSASMPEVAATLTLDHAKHGQLALGRLKMAAGLRSSREASFDLAFVQPGGGRLTARGQVGLSAKTADIEATTQALDLVALRLLAPKLLKEIRGKLSIRLAAKGPFGGLRPRGTIRLEQGYLRLFGMPPLDELTLALRLAPRRIDLQRLHLASGGTLTAHGHVLLSESLAPRQFSLDATAKRLRISVANVRGAVFNGPIRVRGDASAGGLNARVELPGARLKIPKISSTRSLHGTALPPEVVFVEEQKKEQRAAAVKAAERKVSLQIKMSPLFVHGKEADVELVTDLQVATDVRGRPRIKGKAELRRGWVEVMKNRYNVEEATLLFSGEPSPNPALNILLSRQFDDTKVVIAVTGTAKKPKLELRCDPAVYDRAQLLSLIVTGRTTPVGGGGAETDKGLAVAAAVAQLVAGPVLDKAADALGLDRLGVEVDSNKAGDEPRLRAHAGKFLTDRLYVGFRPLLVGVAEADENTFEGLFEYRLTSRWLLSGSYGDAGTGGVDVLWTIRY